MKRAIICSIIVALMALVTKAGAADPGVAVPDQTADGRFGSKCAMPPSGTDKTFCLVPFMRLLAQPEKYHEKRILLFGYLWNKMDNQPCLYASRARAVEFAPGECVYIPWSAIPRDMVPAVEKGVDIRVGGKFDAIFEGSDFTLWRARNIFLGQFDEVDLIQCLSNSVTIREGGGSDEWKCTIP